MSTPLLRRRAGAANRIPKIEIGGARMEFSVHTGGVTAAGKSIKPTGLSRRQRQRAWSRSRFYRNCKSFAALALGRGGRRRGAEEVLAMFKLSTYDPVGIAFMGLGVLLVVALAFLF
jgi:hypothetical protein